MFAIFRKPATKKSRRRAPRRLGGEWLESRCCPSGLSVGFQATVADGLNVSIQGMVSGGGSASPYGPTAPTSYQVSLSGPVNASVTTDSSGDFSYYGPATGLGTITATATDSDGDSGSGSGDIYDPGPTVSTLNAMATGPGKDVSVTGNVNANSPGGLTVNFSGSAGLAATSTTTNSSGGFALQTTAGQLGNIIATVTDVWGVVSGPISCGIMCTPPQVNNLTVMSTGQGKQVMVTGSVSATPASGLTVDFSGPAGLGATSATTDTNGNFSLTTTAAKLGEVDATVTDIWGQVSPMASTSFSVMPPVIQGFGAIQLENGEWEFEGTVQGPNAAGDSVQITGMATASATPDASGQFSVIVYMGSNPSGTATAVATDIWGQTSQPVTYTIFS